ncbi:hypothetical protein MA16_Dca019138 [Dendrobium catenatum]|uniref:Uncharacterized protein n=1 Tax=Dendrobium catenatum TaxID=906689 RepID=A0A2I0W5F3_9ASPA|nr:hypothetical protein MA16_Dca019138 [Dendrobium catenatum]
MVMHQEVSKSQEIILRTILLMNLYLSSPLELYMQSASLSVSSRLHNLRLHHIDIDGLGSNLEVQQTIKWKIEGSQQELIGDSSLTETDEREHEKLVHLRKKAMSNIATAPFILKRVNESLARINKIERNNINMHSSFKRRKK